MLLEQEPGFAFSWHVRAGQPAGLWQRRPVVLAHRVGLDDDVVVARLGVEGQLGLQLRSLRRGHSGQVDRPRQPHVRVVGVHSADVPGSLDGIERAAGGASVLACVLAGELRELHRLAARRWSRERPGLVERIVFDRRAAEGCRPRRVEVAHAAELLRRSDRVDREYAPR